MDIMCARTGRHFVNVEAARGCSREHHHCNSCPYDKKSDKPIVHFVSENAGVKARQDIDKLMADIKEHLQPKKQEGPKDPYKKEYSDNVTRAIKYANDKVKYSRRPKQEKIVAKSSHTPVTKISKWFFTLLLIFSLSLVGLGVSLFIKTSIPLWILLIFSFIFSTEKWLSYGTRRHKIIGKLYRIILNFSILALLGLIVWTSIQLFSKELTQTPLIGSLILLTEFVFFIWIWKIISKNSWRWPSMKLTIFILVGLFVILAFAGVKPMVTYKDDLISKVTTYWEEQKIKTEEKLIQEQMAEEERLTALGISNPSVVAEEITSNRELRLGLEVVELVNTIRKERGSSGLLWDDKLYEYSLAHSSNMANQRRLFHTNINLPYGENAWGGEGSKSWGAETIVESWMGSSKHRTWLLCPNLQHVAVGIAYSTNGMYASWTFWKSEPQLSDWWYQFTPDSPPEWWY